VLHSPVSHKSQKIAEWTAGLRHDSLDPRYLAFFKLFNARQFFEAHEVLEDLWLQDRASPDYRFYKGLIQLAGAFVHLQKRRPQPAGALLRLSADNLAGYPDVYRQLRVAGLRGMVSAWLRFAGDMLPGADVFGACPPPVLSLEDEDGPCLSSTCSGAD